MGVLENGNDALKTWKLGIEGTGEREWCPQNLENGA